MPPHVSIDPTQFDDPIAMQTEWVPLAGMGVVSNVRTHNLVKVNDNRLEFRETLLTKLIRKLIGPFFVLGGTVVLTKSLFHSQGGIGVVLASLLMIFLGWLFFKTASAETPIVFDKDIGFFWRSTKVPTRLDVSDKKETERLAQFLEQFFVDSPGNNLPSTTDSAQTPRSRRRSMEHYRDVTATFAPLEDIHALQLLVVQNKNDDDNGVSYTFQLNLVLRSGKRLNVVEHGNQKGLRQDTEILSAFLEKPIWDATVKAQ